jgi:hypothetical protein
MPETTLVVNDDLQVPSTVDAQVEAAMTFTVADQGDYDIAAELLAQLAGARKEIERRRKELVGPVKQLTTKIDTAARLARQPIESAETQLRGRMSTYLNQQEAIRRVAEEERAKADAQAGEISDPEALPERADPRVRTSGGAGVGARKRWTFEAEDVVELAFAIVNATQAKGGATRALQLASCLTFDKPAIRELVAKGERDIPGVRIFETNDVVVR